MAQALIARPEDECRNGQAFLNDGSIAIVADSSDAPGSPGGDFRDAHRRLNKGVIHTRLDRRMALDNTKFGTEAPAVRAGQLGNRPQCRHH